MIFKKALSVEMVRTNRLIAIRLLEKTKGSAINSQPRDFNGGAKRDRTADLYNAIVALSQLSYGPKFRDGRVGPWRCVDNGGGGASQEGL